jgi:arylsulfatase A-like enzyme
VNPSGWKQIRRIAQEGASGISLHKTLETVVEALDDLASVERWLIKLEISTLLPPWNVPVSFGELYAELNENETEDDSEEEAESPPRQETNAEDEAFLRLQANYAAAVSFLDDGIGLLFDELRERGLLDDLLVLVTSDSGQGLGDRFVPKDAATFLHEELVHLPLILRLPGQAEAGRRVSALTQPVDLLPTLFDYLAIPAAVTQGRCLVPLVRGHVGSVRGYACSGLRFGDAAAWALRTPEWSFLLPAENAADTSGRRPRLFVKPDDRWEVNDVAHHHPELTEQLEQTLRGFVAATQQSDSFVTYELPARQDGKL